MVNPSPCRPNRSSPALEVRRLCKSYGATRVLCDLDLDVMDGELLVLLGPSGCGKTTLLRIISGLVSPDAGTVSQWGRDITHLPAHKRDMGLVFQNYALFPHLDVSANVAFGLRMRKVPKQEITQQVLHALEIVHLAGLDRRRISQLSGGQQQRVALARALVLCPTLLLMDEPLSNLDAKLRASVRVEIAQIQKEMGITTILVTHDQLEAMTMADRIILMQNGAIEQASRPTDVYNYPATTFVAEFVGSPSINMFNAHVDAWGARLPQVQALLPTALLSACLKDDLSPERVPGGEYLLAVRPEDVELARGAEVAGALACGTVTYVEPLGSETLVHLRVDEKAVVARLPCTVTHLRSQDQVGFSFRPNSCHLFDHTTRRRAGVFPSL